MPSLVNPGCGGPDELGPQPVIESGQLGIFLRPWRHADAGQLVAALADADIQRWNLHGISTIAQAQDWIDEWHARWRERLGASWAVTGRASGDVVLGQIGFRSLHLPDGLAELSCWVSPGARRKHVATDSTRMLSEWALETVGLKRLEIVHSTLNPASCQAADRAGFQIEGVKRSLQRHADGFHDMCMHSRISSEGNGRAGPAAAHASVRRRGLGRVRRLIWW
jgi:RimJ/RimL family protein N-acetyltransferase